MLNIENKLVELADKYEKSVDELHKLYNQYLEEVKKDERWKKLPASKQRLTAYRKLIGKLSAEKHSGVEEYEAIIIGISKIEDVIERMRRIAESIWRRNSEDAIKAGYTDSNGVPLDYRSMRYGRPNPNYGQVLDPNKHEYERRAIGLFRRVGDTKWTKGTILASGERFVESIGNLPLFKPIIIKLRGDIRDGEYRFYWSTFTEWENSDIDVDIEKELRKIAVSVGTATSNGLVRTYEPIIVYGFVDSVSNRSITLMDDNDIELKSIRCLMNNILDYNLSNLQYMEAYVVGRFWKSNRNGSYFMEVWGIYVKE